LVAADRITSLERLLDKPGVASRGMICIEMFCERVNGNLMNQRVPTKGQAALEHAVGVGE
jgi:hypothetical protein